MIRREGDRFFIDGPITMENVTTVLSEGSDLAACPSPVVDLSGVREVDSSAVSLMLEWSRRARGQGGSVTFSGLPANLCSLLELYGVAELIGARDGA